MKFLVIFALGVVCAVSTTTFANDNYEDALEKQVQTDVNFEKNKQKAVQELQKRGYIVDMHEIEIDVYRGKPVLEIEARKNGQKYDIVMEYPSLKIIKEELDR